MKVNQRTGVVNSILSVLSERGVESEMNGEVCINEVLNDSDKIKVRSILFSMFRENKIEFKSSFQSKVDDDSELKKYVSGLVNNWIRKCKEFNNGQVYQPKNPGSRMGSQDGKIKEMKKLLSITSDERSRVLIQQTIDNRIQELKSEKNVVEINVNNLPESLRHLIK